MQIIDKIMDVHVVTIIIVLYVESEQLISLTFTKVYFYFLEATEPAMFSGHGEVLIYIHTARRIIHITNRKYTFKIISMTARSSDPKASPILPWLLVFENLRNLNLFWSAYQGLWFKNCDQLTE